MYSFAAPVLPLILIDLVFGAVMLAAGVVSGIFLFRRQSKDDTAVDAHRAKLALQRVRELATSVARDVGQHTSEVQEISAELADAAAERGEDIDNVVLDTVARMVEANERLHSQLAMAEQRLRQQAEEIETHAADARTDPLTKLANRRALDAELERRFAEWKRIQTPYCLFMVDVDHFKKFNDEHGHQAGDEVLRGVAQVLKSSMREMDVVCRYGGEEFAVVMPATEGEVARRGAERARQAIEAARFRFEGKQLQVTASVGLAQIDVGEDNETLVGRADEALYVSKDAGRNCGHYHNGQELIPLSPAHASSAADPETAEAHDGDETAPTPVLDRLPDHQVFAAELRRRIAEGQRFEVPLSLMLIHLDDYRKYVSQYGDPVANVVLDAVAEDVESQLREMDLVAFDRPGRLVAMLPGSTLQDTLQVANRVRSSLEQRVVTLGEAQIQPVCSFGLAATLPSDDIDSITERTSAALFAASSAGPGTIQLHDGKTCQPAADPAADSVSA